MLSHVAWIFLVWILTDHRQAGVEPIRFVTTQTNEPLKVEKGRETIGQTCVPCHADIMRVIQLHTKSADEWRDTVYSMIGRGAQVLPDEIEPVAVFLAANGGRKPIATLGPRLPEAEGKTILERSCQRCHDLTVATTRPASEAWPAVVAKMVTYGAVVTSEDRQKLIEYLNGLAR
jgi:cytochrome c5